MNRSQSLLARIAVAALALLADGGAAADVTLSVVDATPTARHDGTLPGIGETIFSADVHVEVTPGDAWIAGGIVTWPGTRRPELYLYYTRDPNTGEVLLTAPGFDNDAQMFGTFMSEPRGQTQPARFQAAAAVGLPHDYWGGGPEPRAEPDWLDVAYIESPVTNTLGSGFTQRVTIDISESAYAGRDLYVSTAALGEGHTLLVGFESAAGTRTPPAETLRWGFFAVPEPGTGMLLGLLLLAWLVWPRMRRRAGFAAFLALAVLWDSRTAVAQTALVGPQVRLDASVVPQKYLRIGWGRHPACRS